MKRLLHLGLLVLVAGTLTTMAQNVSPKTSPDKTAAKKNTACAKDCRMLCCKQKADAKNCPMDGRKSCCKKKADAKNCPMDRQESCCKKKADAKNCPKDGKKPRCNKS